MLCKYKDIFGKPNEGVHSLRLFNVAIVDVGLTFIIAYIIQRQNFKFLENISLGVLFVCLIMLSLIIHRLFCVDTTLTKMVFGKSN